MLVASVTDTTLQIEIWEKSVFTSLEIRNSTHKLKSSKATKKNCSVIKQFFFSRFAVECGEADRAGEGGAG